jgi:hypothetical protein
MFNRKLKKQVKKLKTELTKNSFKIREMESWSRAFKYRLDEIENIVDEKKVEEIPFDIRNKILNDYGKLLQRNFVYNFNDDTIKKSINAYLNKNL